MAKKISIPITRKNNKNIDEWVSSSENQKSENKVQDAIQIKRFTFDMPISLHTALKIKATEKNTTMAEIAISAIEKQVKK